MDTVMCVKYLFLRFRQYIVKTFINQAVQIPRKADDTSIAIFSFNFRPPVINKSSTCHTTYIVFIVAYPTV